MRYKFYDSAEYRTKQSQKTILAWKAGHYDHNLTEVEDRNINLVLILKREYLGLQEDFSPFIKNWEFS